MFLRCLMVVTQATLGAIAPNASAAAVWGTDATGGLTHVTGSRSTGSGLTGTGSWDNAGLTLSWDISLSGNLWTYIYTINTVKKVVSHSMIEVAEDQDNPFTAQAGSDAFEGDQTWGSAPSNPGIPNSLFGIKFDFGNDNGDTTYTLVTAHAPVWGTFYTKGGKDKIGKTKVDLYAYSNGLASTDYKTSEQLTAMDFIVRPNGIHTDTPEIPGGGGGALTGSGGEG